MCEFYSLKYSYSVSELFDNYMQQDAHEFLNYLLNRVAELLQGKLLTVALVFTLVFCLS